MKKEVKEQVQISDLYFYIVKGLRNGRTLVDIYSSSGLSKQNFQYYIDVLKRAGIIRKPFYAVWELTKEYKEISAQELEVRIGKKRSTNKSSLGTSRKKANLHALNINIPIVKGEVNLIDGYEVQLKNWVQQHKRFPGLGLTIRNNNNKSLSIYVWSREIFDTLAIPAICHIVVHATCTMMKEQNVYLDYFGWRVTTLHIMIRNEELDQVMNKGLKIEVLLNRNVEKITENDVTQQAMAWVDSSPYKGVETNDLEYYKNYILMPENMATMAKGFQQLSNNLIPAINRQTAASNSLSHNVESQLVPVMQGLKQHWESHLPMIQSTTESNITMQTFIKKAMEVIEKLAISTKKPRENIKRQALMNETQLKLGW